MSPLLDTNRAADLLALSPWTIRLYTRTGKLNAIKIGRSVRYEETELQRFIEQNRSAPVSESVASLGKSIDRVAKEGNAE